MSLVVRSAVLAYMNIQENPLQVPRYRLIGDGFTKLVNNKEPTEYTRKFVNRLTQTTDVIKYQSEIVYEIDVMSRDEVIQRILHLTDGERRRTAITDIVTVTTNDVVARPHVCKATRRQYKIVPNSIGDDVQILRVTGKMVTIGETENGFFDISTGRYKPASPYEGHSIAYFNKALFNRGYIARKEY